MHIVELPLYVGVGIVVALTFGLSRVRQPAKRAMILAGGGVGVAMVAGYFLMHHDWLPGSLWALAALLYILAALKSAEKASK